MTPADREAITGMVRRLPDVAHDAQVRHRRAGHEEQPRDLLGHAGRGLRAGDGQPGRPRRLPAAPDDDPAARSDGGRRLVSRSSWPGPSRTATRSSTSTRSPASARSSRRRRTTSGRSRCPTAGGWLAAIAYLFPFLKDKSALAGPEGRDVLRSVAGPPAQPALCGPGVHEPRYLDLWRSLEGSPKVDEVLRNLPIRHPLLWVPVLPRQTPP